MIKFFIAFFLFFSTMFLAQTKRFVYELEYKESREKDDLKKKFMVLDINPDDIKYYDYKFVEKDSLNKLYNTSNTNWTDQVPIVRKKNSNHNLNYVDIGNLFYYETIDELPWKLENTTKKIEHFEVQKATLDFGGRHWEAWFTKDIPFQEGPYKFRGLPGMIVSIKDDQNNYIFNLVNVQNMPSTYDTSNFLEVRYGNKPIKITEKIALKKAQELYNNPLYDIAQGLSSGKILSFEYYGTKYEGKDLPKLIKQEQKDILEYYNPIELNKALYPIEIK